MGLAFVGPRFPLRGGDGVGDQKCMRWAEMLVTVDINGIPDLAHNFGLLAPLCDGIWCCAIHQRRIFALEFLPAILEDMIDFTDIPPAARLTLHRGIARNMLCMAIIRVRIMSISALQAVT